MLLETTFCLLCHVSVCTYAVCSEVINVFIHLFASRRRETVRWTVTARVSRF